MGIFQSVREHVKVVFFHRIFQYLYPQCAIQNCALSYFFDLINVFYIAYADDILLLSRSRSSLSNSVSSISKHFQSVGVSFNIDKCELLAFNANPIPTCLPCSNFSVRCVSELWWLGIQICSKLFTFRTNIVQDGKEKLKMGNGKILANRGHCSRKALALLHSSFCDHSILFLSGTSPIMKKKDLAEVDILYFRYCKFLLYLPPSYRNKKIFRISGLLTLLLLCGNLA